MSKAVVLVSGGMDSATALALAVKEHENPNVVAVSFNYGQRHRDQELQAANQLTTTYGIRYHHTINLSQLQALLGGSALTDRRIEVPDGHYTAPSMAITVVPNRNAIMLSIAFGIARAAGATQVYAGMHAGDHAIYPDCRYDFVLAFDKAMQVANDDIPHEARPHLKAPFIHLSKGQIARMGAELGVPFGLTYSCYKGARLHCGTCGTCVERREAFNDARIRDPTQYATGLAPVQGAGQ